MKQRYILAAANRWNGDTATSPLPSTIPEDKLREIDMVHPVFPTLHQFIFNPFLITGHPDVINAMIAAWQERSHRLAAWISKAKPNSSYMLNCSWAWPTSPSTPVHSIDSPIDSSVADTSSMFPEVESIAGESNTPVSHAIHALRAQASLVPLKRHHDPSPLNSERDGDDPNKKTTCPMASLHSTALGETARPRLWRGIFWLVHLFYAPRSSRYSRLTLSHIYSRPSSSHTRPTSSSRLPVAGSVPAYGFSRAHRAPATLLAWDAWELDLGIGKVSENIWGG